MMDRRDASRWEMRHQRAQEKVKALAKTSAATERASSAVNKARCILADPTFADTLRSQGILSVPLVLTKSEPQSPALGGNLAASKAYLNEVSLDFVIAWRFFYPFFSNSMIEGYLERSWPGFILEMKDAFIAIVVEGPFPQPMSGFRGRRPNADYLGDPIDPAVDRKKKPSMPRA